MQEIREWRNATNVRYIYEQTMIAISAEKSVAKLLLNASDIVLLHRKSSQFLQ